MNSAGFIILGTPGTSDMIWFYAGVTLLLLLLVGAAWLFRALKKRIKKNTELPDQNDLSEKDREIEQKEIPS